MIIDGIPFLSGGGGAGGGGVVFAEEPPVEIDVTPKPSPFVSPAPTSTTSTVINNKDFIPLSPSIANIFTSNAPTRAPPTLPPVTIRKEAVGVLFDMVLDYTGTANFNQITKDIDGVLENYIFLNLRFLEKQGLDIRDVMLGVTVSTRRRLQLQLQVQQQQQLQQPVLRRWLQAAPTFEMRGLVVRVDGNVIYDIDADGCVECVDKEIETELEDLLTADALDELVRSAQIEGVNGVTGVREAQQEDQGNSNTQVNAAQGTEPNDDGLTRPSTLSIAFGFALTAIAAMGLVFYVYLFCKKRRKRLRKERQQRETIEYRMPSSRVSPTMGSTPPKRSPGLPPPAPTSASTPIPADEQSEMGVEALEAFSPDGGPGDAFALELQMAASRDQQAWESFQRKKRVLDHDRGINQTNSGPMEFASPIPLPPPNAEDLSSSRKSEAWSKSFPYGDEQSSAGLQEQGVEWTDEDFGAEERKWEQYSSTAAYQPEEKKDDVLSVSRVARDPEPAIPFSRESSAVLQSIEQTLSQYSGSKDEDYSIDDPSEAVDEVARLSRFVKRFDKRKQRRTQRESERHSKSPPESSSPPAYSHEPVVQRSTPPNQNENNGYLNNMRPSPTLRAQDRRSNDNKLLQDSHQPRKSSYMGITMTGEMYQDPSLQRIDHPALSMSDDSADDSYRYEDEGARSQRLGITPFSVQRPNNAPLYSEDRLSLPKNFDREEPSNRMEQRPRTKSEGESFQSQRARLQDLRKNEAIIDSTRSEINVGNNPYPGQTRVPIPASFLNGGLKTPQPKTTSQNPKFSKLRNLFEELPKNAIFPPDEHWQSGKLLDSNKKR